MLDITMTYAVIGANNDEKKYGFKVYKDLLDAGYSVIPVNPKEKEILGQICYPSLSDYDKRIDFVVFAVPPVVTEKVLHEIVKINASRADKIHTVWMQPGSESSQSISYCESNGITCIAHSCIMIQRKKSDSIL
jgi:uncharacterized protein